MNNVAIFLFCLSSNVILKLLLPGITFFPMELLALIFPRKGVDLLRRIEHVLEHNASASHVDVDR